MNNKNIIIFCISDIHVNSNNSIQIKRKFEKLIQRVKSIRVSENASEVIFLFIGDIAFSGKKLEYDLLKSEFKKIKEIGSIIITPGNHDHNFEAYANEGLRDASIKYAIEDRQFDESTLEACSKGQLDFLEFNKEFSVHAQFSFSKLFEEHTVVPDVYLKNFNSSWCSKISERNGDLFFPESELITKRNEKLKIAAFHHPLIWFNADNSKKLRNSLIENYNIVFTGHEHLADGLKISRQNKDTIFVENLPFDDNTVKENGFCYLSTNLEKYRVTKLVWKDDKFESVEMIDENMSTSTLSNTGLKHKEKFIKEMNDIGALLNHPTKGVLTLADIFVYPNLTPSSSHKNTLKRFSSNQLIKKLENGCQKILILGEESSGKTTLLKRLYLDFINSNMNPLFVNGETINKASNFRIKKLEKSLKEQYELKEIEDYIELQGEKILLIDNFEQIKFSERSFEQFLDIIQRTFDHIIVCASDTLEFSQTSLNPIPGLSLFTTYEILRFGYHLRYELINKWNSLEEQCQYDKSHLIQSNHTATKLFDTVLSKGVIPSLPLFLTTMLQSIYSDSTSDPNTSTYGYYYQYLITSAMGAAKIKKESLDEYFQYLSELAFYLFTEDRKLLDKEQLNSFNRLIKDKYGIEFENETRKSKLIEAGLVSESNGFIGFKYHYIYFFFIAKYLSTKIDESEKTIFNLIDNIHVKKNMNILMFLTHHSRNNRVLDGIVNKSRSLVSGVSPSDLYDSVDFVNEIMKSEPVIEYKKELQDPLDYRRKQAIRSDENYDEKKELSDSEHDDVPDFFREVISSFKSTELLSQLAKNYYGSLERNRKEELISEAIQGPLRALEAIIMHFRDDPEKVVSYVKANIKRIKSDEAISDTEVERLARAGIFNLIMTLCYSTIGKISFSISDKNISSIITKVCDSNSNRAYKMISFICRMETGGSINPDELNRLCQDLRKNKLALTLLKAFVLRYLYMFEIKDEKVQAICKIAKINYGSVAQRIGVEKISSKEKNSSRS